jgi:hypothetical protein
VSQLRRASPTKVGRECKLGRARLRRPSHFVLSSESRDISCHFSYKKIRDSSTALGMTKRAPARRTCIMALASAFLSDVFPGRARLRRAGCKTCHGGAIPKSGQKFPETEELLELPIRIAPGQLNQTLQFTRVVECWHNLCSEHETTPLLPVVHSVPQA